MTCELAAIPVDAEFIGGSVVALDELNPIAILVVRAGERESGSLGGNEPGLQRARNFDCKLSIFIRDQNGEFVRWVRDVRAGPDLERALWDLCVRSGSAQ